MKRIWKFFSAVALCTALLCGCSTQKEQPASSASPADPLTGQQLRYPGERAVAVVISNAPGTTQQWGLGSASVVLEIQTEEDAPTDLCLVYPSLSAMPTVGPVTAGQDIFWRLLCGQEVLPVQWGSNPYARRYLDHANLRAVDALSVGTNAFESDTSWNTVSLWRTSGSKVRSVLSSLGISAQTKHTVSSDQTAADSALPPLFPQAKDGQPEPSQPDAAALWIDFPSASSTGFAYDSALGNYKMSPADGSAQRDANTGQQVRFNNILVLYSASSLRDDAKTLDYDLTMGGGIWLNGGQLWQITWTQGTDSTFSFYAADGKQLDIRPGRSYLALLSSLTGQELRIFDSTGQELPNLH